MIKVDNTHWVFICGAFSESVGLTRHVLDIAFGINALIKSGVSKSNISVLLDHSSDNWLNGVEDPSTFDEISVEAIANYTHVFSVRNDLNNLVLFILGHGSSSGIDSPIQLKPNDLCNAIYSKDNLDCCVVFFGQCYGGIYRYVDLNRNKLNAEQKPKVCFIGASSYDISISTNINIDNASVQSWNANVFLVKVFEWLSSSNADVDGDGHKSLMDAYKFSSIEAQQLLLTAKVNGSYFLYTYQKAYNNLSEKPQDSQTPEEKFNQRQAEIEIFKQGQIVYSKQDSWILNSNTARDIHFNL